MGENTNRSEPFFDEDVDLVKLQFTDIFGQCKMVQMTRRQAEKAMKEGYAINRFALGGLQKAGIEGAAALGSVVSCILWAQHRKYARWSESIKANVRSGAFVMKEGKE